MGGGFGIVERLYGALLHLYPKRFRAVYSEQMRLTFRDSCRTAYRRNGAGGLLALWLPTLLDLFKSALEERARQGEIIMSKERLITLAAPLTLIVGILWLTAAALSFLLLIGSPDAEMLISLFPLPFLFSFILMLFALIGITWRFHPAASAAGKFGLALSAAGCAGVITAVLATMLLGGTSPEAAQNPLTSYAALIAFMSIRVGFILFGIDTLRHKLLPRWNALPLLLGATLVLGLPMGWFGAPPFLQLPAPLALPFVHFAIAGVCWVLIGMAMTTPRPKPQPAAAGVSG